MIYLTLALLSIAAKNHNILATSLINEVNTAKR